MPAAAIRASLAGLCLAVLSAGAPRAVAGDTGLKGVEEAIGKQDFARAVQLATQYIDAHPGEARPFVFRGFARLSLGDFDRGIADLSEAIRLDPALHQALVLRGRARFILGRFPEALADLDEAIKAAPDDPICYRTRGRLLFFQREYARALADLDRAVALDPRSAESYLWRGDLYAFQKRYPEALADYDRSLQEDAKSAEAHLRRGGVYGRMKDYAKAADDFKQVIALTPERPDGYNSLAWLLATCPQDGLRNGPQAVKLAQKACALGRYRLPGDVDTLAAAYAEVGDFPAAVRWQERALRLLPATPPERRADYEKRLALYRQGKPYHGE